MTEISASIDEWLRETRQALEPGSEWTLTRPCVPSGRAGDYVNTWRALRDSESEPWFPVDWWVEALFAAGFMPQEPRCESEPIAFNVWAAGVPPETRLRLLVMLEQAPADVQDWLKPQQSDGRPVFFHTICHIRVIAR